MASVKIRIHPLFLVVGGISIFFQNFFIFLIYGISALLHELGHLYVAGRYGYTAEKITLMPYGAVVNMDESALKLKDQIKIALAGPLFNLLIATVFIASWWILPDIYPLTEEIVIANISLALVNLIPVYPLDGGRILQSICVLTMGKRGKILSKIVETLFILTLLVLFILSCFSKPNFSLLFFILFLGLDLFSFNRENHYVKIKFALSKGIKRGNTVKKIAVDKSLSIKRLIALLDAENLNEVEVYDKEKLYQRLNPFEVNSLIEIADVYCSIEKAILLLEKR